MKTSKEKAITLIALVVTIILLLILASVSISTLLGEDGLIERTIAATEQYEDTSKIEKLDLTISEFNIDSAIGEADSGFTSFLAKVKDEGRIEDFFYYGNNVIVKFEGEYYEIVEEDGAYRVSRKLTEDLTGASGSTKIITPDNIKNAENGNLSFNDGDEFIILDNVTVENFNFIIPEGIKVTIKLLGDMKIDNKNSSDKSAIDLGVEKQKDDNGMWQYSNGATLNLYIYGNVTVDSSYGVIPPKNYGDGASGGSGAKAGIRVPKTATLNLYGTGKLEAYGGKAGEGGQCGKNNTGGAGGGRCWSWNRTEIGGKGGDTGHLLGSSSPWIRSQSGMDGEDGESCGTVNIYDSIEVYAYGGAGGSGGLYTRDAGSSGTGGGGYPGAGIGGGRCWSWCGYAYPRRRWIFSWCISRMFISNTIL